MHDARTPVTLLRPVVLRGLLPVLVVAALARNAAAAETETPPPRREGLGHGTHFLLPTLVGVSSRTALYSASPGITGLGGLGGVGSYGPSGLLSFGTNRSAEGSFDSVGFGPRFDVALGRFTVGGSVVYARTVGRASEGRATSSAWAVAPKVGYLVPLAAESLFVWPTLSLGAARAVSRSVRWADGTFDVASAETNLNARAQVLLLVPLGRWVTFGVGPAFEWSKNVSRDDRSTPGTITLPPESPGRSSTAFGLDAHFGLVF